MNNWLECLEYTITTYNKVMKNELLKIYKQNQIAIKKDKQMNLFSNDMVEIDENDIDETLIKCFRKSVKAIQLFEKFNIEKSYKYSIIFKANNIKDDLDRFSSIPNLIDDFQMHELTDKLEHPMKLEFDDKLFL